MLCQHGRRGACGTARTDRVLRCRESPCQGSTFCRIKGRPSGYHCRDDRKATFCRIGGHSGNKNKRDIAEIAKMLLSVGLEDIRGTKNWRKIVETVFVRFILALEGFILHVGLKDIQVMEKRIQSAETAKGSTCAGLQDIWVTKKRRQNAETANGSLCVGLTGIRATKKQRQSVTTVKISTCAGLPGIRDTTTTRCIV